MYVANNFIYDRPVTGRSTAREAVLTNALIRVISLEDVNGWVTNKLHAGWKMNGDGKVILIVSDDSAEVYEIFIIM